MASVVSGVVVAITVAIIGVIIARRYTAKWEAAQARRERDLAAAAELYRVYGEFFATWKLWNAHLRSAKPRPSAQVSELGLPDDRRMSELLGAAAAAEGGCEALLVRITLEHNVKPDQRAALWCLRSAYKQLRQAMLDGEPLLWWRSDIHGSGAGRDGYRAYQAFKFLTSLVADVLLTGPDSQPLPAIDVRLEALRQVTGSGREFTRDERISPAIEKERAGRQRSPRAVRHWEWLVVAEQLLATRSQASSADRVAVPAGASKTRPGLPHMRGTLGDEPLERR